MAEINENIKPWKRAISEDEWNRMWQPQDKLAEALEDGTDWMGLAISLYVSQYGRRCVTCWKDVADQDVCLVTRDGVHYLFHASCKP